MAQQHPDGEALESYLRTQATEFLRALRLLREAGVGDGAGATLLRPTRRLTATLHTYGPLLTPTWTDHLRPELTWLTSTLAQEHTYAARLDRLLTALHRLSGATVPGQSSITTPATGSRAAGAAPAAKEAAPRPRGQATPPTAPPAPGHLPTDGSPGSPTPGAPKAAALLTRRLTLARTRAHSTALQSLDSARFHALADTIAVLASEVPLTRTARTADLRPHATAAEERLTEAIAALPPVTAPGLPPDPHPHPHDTPWHQTRRLLRLHRYAREVLHPQHNPPEDERLLTATRTLDRHQDAAEAAAEAAAAARTPRITPATAYALGVLHADQRHEVEAARFAFQQTWRTQKVALTAR
ncbi:CHAD domain-containing protein [Streptomyces sp. G1]|uniref:CHAD domain-containing protein n=1 Tax=Streptomyces sp. G1 TaxID=361572 RepID=UPI00202F44E6|nr:CHAD domain-containing protein [Streptomyces sp. G1]MCM1968734.1 CHAD domain-containing protein [Streptomyces sp. G1]